MKFTLDNITKLEPNQIFVFGSNDAGRHFAGAANLARKKFGAEVGLGKGLTGQCYAFPTKDNNIKTLPLCDIKEEFIDLIDTCNEFPHKEFLLTKVGTGLAGYSVEEIASLLVDFEIPPNLILPEEFWAVINPKLLEGQP